MMISMLTGCGNDTTKITAGMQLVETLDYQGALTAFDEAEAQKENSRLIARGRGIASMGLTEYDQAVQYFTEALELSDGWVQNVDYDMNYYLAAAYREVGQEYLQNVLNTDKKLDAYDSGRIYYYLGDYQKAYLALEEAKGKGGVDSYLYLGKAYAATGDYNYASSVYSNYLSKQGPDAEIYNQLGLCEMAKKDYQKALEAFQAGKQIEGNSLMQTLSFNEIVAYEYLQDYQKAAVLLKAYLQNYPDDQAAIREQQFLSTR